MIKHSFLVQAVPRGREVISVVDQECQVALTNLTEVARVMEARKGWHPSRKPIRILQEPCFT